MDNQQDELDARRELDWIRRAQLGEREALGALYDRHAARVYRSVLYPLLGNAAAAEDALSETFRTAFGKLATFQPGAQGLYPWLAQIARNKALDMHRATGASRRKLSNLSTLWSPLVASPHSPEHLLDAELSRAALEQAVQEGLAGLNDRYRRAIELRFFEERPRQQCAEALGVKVGTFDVVLLRALRAFRKAWPEVAPSSVAPASRPPAAGGL